MAWPAAACAASRRRPDDDDVDPAYLPAASGFVFSSNRQGLTKTVLNGVTTYAVDEYERERVLNLHTMDPQGGAITQISVNQSHDRNPVVRPNGDIMFSRWEHVGPRNRFAIFRTKPDGTDMFVLYGAHSPGNSFLHPRDMDPKGAYAGQVVSSLMSLSRTHEGGALMMIDAANYSEQNTPANNAAPGHGRPGPDHRQAAEHGPRPFAVRPRHHAVSRCGTAPTACCCPTAPAKSRKQRQRGALRHADRRMRSRA